MVSSNICSCVVVAVVVEVVVEVVEEEVVLLTLVVGARPVVSRCPPGHRIGTQLCHVYILYTYWPDIHNDNLACLREYKCILQGEKKYFFLSKIVVLCPRSWLWGGGSNAWTDGEAGSSSTAD